MVDINKVIIALIIVVITIFIIVVIIIVTINNKENNYMMNSHHLDHQHHCNLVSQKVEKEVEMKEIVTLSSVIEGLKEVTYGTLGQF